MRPAIWTLPGPARFVHRTVEALGDGRAPTLVLPNASEPAGLAGALREQATLAGLMWRHLDAAAVLDAGEPPAAAFGRQIGTEPPEPGQRVRTDRLACDPALRGVAALIDLRELPDRVNTDGWWRLLVALTAAWRDVDVAERGTVCTLARADQLPEGPGGDIDVLLPVRWWWGVIDRLDTRLYATSCLGDDEPDPVRVATVAEVAQFDLQLVTHLMDQWDLTLDTLPKLLSEYRDRVDLPSRSVPRTRCPREQPVGDAVAVWACGLQQRWGTHTQPTDHAANAHAVDSDELRGRAWAGQVSLLLPEIERARWQLVRWIQTQPDAVQSRLPVDDLPGIEVTPLKELIEGDSILRQDRQRLDLARWLSQARNKLAHLEPIEHPHVEKGLRLMEHS